MMKLTPSLSFPLRAAAAIALLFAATALAQHGHDRGHDRGHGHGHPHGHGHGHGTAPHFYGPGWHGGHWAHGDYGGRTGWWWVVGPSWYYYPAPVYPYPAPPQAIVAGPLPAPAQYWYYCEPLRGYYPNVSACPTPWRVVLSTPGAIAPAPILQVP
jgi:hypothetical protein